MKTLIELKDDKWIRCLGQSCLEKCLQDNNRLISKICFLTIIFENFKELSENHPAFIASALSVIGFVVPSTKVTPNSISSHLSSYGKYHHLSKSFYDRLISNFRVCWISFQNSFETFQNNHPTIRSLIIKPFIDFYYVGHSSTILAIPLPNFVSYPKAYNFWGELLLPNYPSYSTDPNDPWNLVATYNTIDPNGTIENNSSLIEPPTATTNMFMFMSTAIAAVYMMITGQFQNYSFLQNFYECHTITLREHVMFTQKDKWTGYKKPYIPPNLNKILLLPEEEPSLKEIMDIIEELRKRSKK
ncbi:12642_t:CDS:2 [Dentiscutata heterogama]|uniref:12642_t:CDS:1 n=1 Tax=Dentiscutata heterogama TaxID=1316150 RepID=A0ACA9L750_9GLOM|nr:12642_t:CDS:2 [Dentiscutata heterogama]